MKTAARFTLADINRVIRAAKEQGADAVEILPDGTIRIIIKDMAKREQPPPPQKIRDFEM